MRIGNQHLDIDKREVWESIVALPMVV